MKQVRGLTISQPWAELIASGEKFVENRIWETNYRGPNGAGKTTAIACINALLGQKVGLTPSRGASEGSIEGLGVEKRIRQKTINKGEAEVASLEGRFDFSDLVEPSIKDPEARNKARVRG